MASKFNWFGSAKFSQRIIVCVMVSLGFCVYVNSASAFNCQQAYLKVDHVICSDPALVDIIDSIQTSWIKLKNSLGSEDAKTYLDRQRAWIKKYTQECGISGHGTPTGFEIANAHSCVQKALQERLAYLENTYAAEQKKGNLVYDTYVCDYKEQFSTLIMETMNRRAEVASFSQTVLTEIGEINNKAKIPNRPIGEQLPQSDIVRFSELSQQLKTQQLISYIESNRERDISVIIDMISITENEFKTGKLPDDKSVDVTKIAPVKVLSLLTPDTKITVPSKPECTPEMSVHLMELSAIKEFNNYQSETDKGNKYITYIRHKYHTDIIDFSKTTQTGFSDISFFALSVYVRIRFEGRCFQRWKF